MALPSVFLSYPRTAPDRGGKIARLREALTTEIRALTGDTTFEIFDGGALGFGENSRRVEQELGQASFLLPIVQPLLFTSNECRAELEAFIAREKQLGRDDLILPIYYIECENFSVHSEDPLRRTLAGRRYEDCRHLRRASDEQIEDAADTIAKRMVAAFKRLGRPTQTRSGPAPTAAPPAAPANPAGKKLRILLTAANPADLDPVEVQREHRIIEEELHPVARRVRVDSEWATTAGVLLDSLDRYKPEILHFSGHGNDRGEPMLLATDTDEARPIPGELLERMLRVAPQLRCVVFNSCYSLRIASQLVGRLRLVVIGMHDRVESKTALEFARHFYRGVARGKNLRDAVEAVRAGLATRDTAEADLVSSRSHPDVEADDVVLLPSEPASPAASSALPDPAAATTGGAAAFELPPGILPEHRELLVRLLLSMFSSSEFQRLLRYGSETAGILPRISNEHVAPLRFFGEAVDALAEEGIIDAIFFQRLVHERPRREREIRQVQQQLLGPR